MTGDPRYQWANLLLNIQIAPLAQMCPLILVPNDFRICLGNNHSHVLY